MPTGVAGKTNPWLAKEEAPGRARGECAMMWADDTEGMPSTTMCAAGDGSFTILCSEKYPSEAVVNFFAPTWAADLPVHPACHKEMDQADIDGAKLKCSSGLCKVAKTLMSAPFTHPSVGYVGCRCA